MAISPAIATTAPRAALFVTFAKPCEEALNDLSVAYNRLADEVERLWPLEEQLQAARQTAAMSQKNYDNACARADELEEQLQAAERVVPSGSYNGC